MFERMSFDPVTEHTITDPEELRAEIEAGRERGYYFNREESLPRDSRRRRRDLRPGRRRDRRDQRDRSPHRLNGERLESDLPDLLLGAANELELNIAHS